MSDPRESQAAAIIPVRIGSQRLPGKALLAESGRPLFLHAWRQASLAERISEVFVATDSEEVAAAAEAAGAQVRRTGRGPRTGTERCAEAAQALPFGVFLNLQGDWPEIDPGDLDRMAEQLLAGEAVCNTLAAPLDRATALADANVVKVVRGLDGTALYFSRAPIPYLRHGPGDRESFQRLRHVGAYGFARQTLLEIPQLPSSGLAEAEHLEQLQWLDNGIAIQVLDSVGQPWGIETRADYDAFLSRLEAGVNKH